jgi:PAS domain S-box-containing protein
LWRDLLQGFIFGRTLAWSLGWLLAFGNLHAASTVPKRVLVVHSFVNAAPPFTTHSTAFETELTEKMGERVDLDEVSLDMARYGDIDMQEALVDYLQKRQVRWQPDLVVPIGSPAGIFVAQHRSRLYPEIPIVYTGLDKRRLPAGALENNAVFVGEDFNVRGFVEDILQVAPGTTNIAMVLGASELERYWADAFRSEFAPFTNRVNFTWLNELSFDQMLERVSKLPPRSFIFLALLMRDITGVTLNGDEALKRIHAVANAPVNSIFQNQMGLGIVGGRLYQAELEGVESARAAIRILKGEPASSFPPRIIGPLPPRYDWRELQRWNISEDLLPRGSTVFFREQTVWQRYRHWFIGGVSLCILQGVFIFVLLVNQGSRRRAEQSLRENRNRLRAILNTAVEAIITVTEGGLIESTNLATGKIFGYHSSELIGTDISLVLPPPRHEEHARLLPDARAGFLSKRIDLGHEVRGRRKDGSRFPIDLAVSEIMLADRRAFTFFVRDITERRQAERTARDLSGRLIHAQEAERARLARELHDDITQRLARLAIDAGRAAMADTANGELIRDVRDGLIRLSEDVHSLSYQLHPALLEDLGLADALKAECERFAQQELIPIKSSVETIPRGIPFDTGLCLFRVTQEALRNVARHARARAAAVSLRSAKGGLELAVTDSGVGFNLHNGHRHRPSLGLASMRERVRLVGGVLDIESAPGHGTSVVAWVPLNVASA